MFVSSLSVSRSVNQWCVALLCGGCLPLYAYSAVPGGKRREIERPGETTYNMRHYTPIVSWFLFGRWL